MELMCIPGYEFLKYAPWPPIRGVHHSRQPRGIVRITAFVEGFIAGLRTSVHRTALIFIGDRG